MWYRICREIPKTEKYILPIEYILNHTTYLIFTYYGVELQLKIKEDYSCIYLNHQYYSGDLFECIPHIISLLDMYFIPYDF